MKSNSHFRGKETLYHYANTAGLEDPKDDNAAVFHLLCDLIAYADATEPPRFDIRAALEEAEQFCREND